jgi:hypothetical protein
MPRLMIFDSSVCRGIPSLAAAPDGPEMRPRHAAKAVSINARSCSASAATNGTAGLDGWGDSRSSQVSSTAKGSLSHRMTARSMTFCFPVFPPHHLLSRCCAQDNALPAAGRVNIL